MRILYIFSKRKKKLPGKVPDSRIFIILFLNIPAHARPVLYLPR